MNSYVAVCPRLPGNELAAAECENLTGGKPALDGIAACQSITEIPRAAYIQKGMRLIAEASTLDELVHAISTREFEAEDFCIEHVNLSKNNSIFWPSAVVDIAKAIKGFPNLNHPRHHFFLLIRQSGLLFGEILARSDQSYKPHRHKPYHLSSSLPAQMARALVNLLPLGVSSLLDPCCGTGSVLLEAHAIGVAQLYGSDWNPPMVGMARKNMAHFGYPAEIVQMDARQCQQSVDAIVTDLPYGRFAPMDEDNLRGILQTCARLAPVAVYVAGADISPWLYQAGYTKVELFQVRKRRDFSRFVHRASQ
jgi:tRNA G10  N-methylase Trm11